MYKFVVVLAVFLAPTKQHVVVDWATWYPAPWVDPMGPVPPMEHPWPDLKTYRQHGLFSVIVDYRYRKRKTTTSKTPTTTSTQQTIESETESTKPGSSNTPDKPQEPNDLLSLVGRINPGPEQPTTVISLEYKPTRPFYHPNPGDTLGQIIPPGKPWPDSEQGYQKPSQGTIVDRIKDTDNEAASTNTETTTGFVWEDDDVLSTTSVVVDRIQEDSEPSTSSSVPSSQTPISLEYKPNRPFHHSNPGNTLKPIVPTGKPWPDSVQGYQNFSQVTPNLEDRIKETEGTTSGGFVWEDDLEEKQSTPNLVNRIQDSSTSVPKDQTPISLEYKPMRPFYHPNPGNNLGQIVPPGKPWPSSPQGYQNFSQVSTNLVNRIKDTTTEASEVQDKTPISLEYKPSRPPFHPNPGDNIGQIIPPGKPWPSSPDGYQNFSQNAPDLVNRVKETTGKTPISLEYKPTRPPLDPNPGDTIGQIVPPGNPLPSSPEGTQNSTQIAPPPSLEDRIQERVPTTTVISLAYKPTRPFYHPRPGSSLGQIVPPGKPWPSNQEGYQSFSQTTRVPNVIDRFAQNKPWPDKLEAGFARETETSSEVTTDGKLYTSALRDHTTAVKNLGGGVYVAPSGGSEAPSGTTRRPSGGGDVAETTTGVGDGGKGTRGGPGGAEG